MLALNPDIHVVELPEKLSGTRLLDAIAVADVVLDCSDRFAARHEINRACVQLGKPLVSGAAIRFDGQVSVFDTRQRQAPCYACLYPQGDEFEEERCATMGVFAPLVGIVGTMQAAEAIKLLAGLGEPLTGRLLTIDAFGMNLMSLGIKRQALVGLQLSGVILQFLPPNPKLAVERNVASALRNRQCQLWSVCLELPLEVRAQSLDDAVQCPALFLQRIAEFLNDGVAGNGNGPPFNRGDVAPNRVIT
jgi:hypothetical protein